MSLGRDNRKRYCTECGGDELHVAEPGGAGVVRCTACSNVSAALAAVAPASSDHESGPDVDIVALLRETDPGQARADRALVPTRTSAELPPKGSTSGSSTGSTSGSHSGSTSGSPSGSRAAPSARGCDRTLHGKSLIAFDADERLIDFALAAAGLDTLLDTKQTWRIDGREITVSKWLNEKNGNFALRVWAGYPPSDSFAPAMIYAYARCGKLYPLTEVEHAKQKLRLMVDAGIIPRPDITLPDLPDNARRAEIIVWEAIKEILVIDRACGCHPPGTPIVAAPSYIAMWTGFNPSVCKDALRRLRHRHYLRKTGKTRIPGSHPANLYSVLGDGHHDTDPPATDNAEAGS